MIRPTIKNSLMSYLATHYRCCVTDPDYVETLLDRYRAVVSLLEKGQITALQFAVESLRLITELDRDPVVHELIGNYQRTARAQCGVLSPPDIKDEHTSHHPCTKAN